MIHEDTRRGTKKDHSCVFVDEYGSVETGVSHGDCELYCEWETGDS
jgi:hypothetical protein